jgi:hypothetical protein
MAEEEHGRLPDCSLEERNCYKVDLALSCVNVTRISAEVLVNAACAVSDQASSNLELAEKAKEALAAHSAALQRLDGAAQAVFG